MASVKDMHDWGINIGSCRQISGTDYESLARNDCKPLKNDVLIAKDGSYLKHVFVVNQDQDLVILSSIAMLRPNNSIFPSYLCFSLRDPVVKARMKGIVTGVAIPRIVLKDFRNFEIVVPAINTQAAWVHTVTPMLDACQALIAQIDNLRSTRDLLLPRLLSGQIDVEALPEPALD
jgi:type I restriction enzyme S subunit